MTQNKDSYDVWMDWPGREMKKWVKRQWRDQHQAEDVLAGGQELFARRCRPGYPLPRRVRFAQLCCRNSARMQGFWGSGRGSREVATDPTDLTQTLALSHQDGVWDMERRDLLRRAEAAMGLLSPPLRLAAELVLSGDTQAEAAIQCGINPTALSQALARVGEAVLGRPVIRQQRRCNRVYNGQLALDWL